MPGRKLTSILEQRQPVLVQSDDTIAHAAREMSRLAQNAALVLRKSRTVGIITETDIIRRVIATGRGVDDTLVQHAMTENPVAARAEHTLGQALYLMHAHGVHHIPVVERGKAIGMIYASDALASDLSEYASDAEMLDHLAEVI